MIAQPDPSNSIVNNNGIMTDQFRIFTYLLSRLDLFSGTGSPEGVVEAQPKQIYMDTTGTAGSILYIKRDASVAGDKSKGWILV